MSGPESKAQDKERRPVVSVLMSVYNEQPAVLERAVRSVLCQTFADFEFLLLDDGSTDAQTLSALEALANQDARIRLCREPHRGLTRTLNVGLSYCRGEFICRQDSDDWSEPERFERQVAFLRANPQIGMVGSHILLHREDGEPLWQGPFPETPEAIITAFPAGNPFCHGSVCLRRAAAEQIGGYREELPCSQDYDCFWRLCERFGGANLPEPLYHHRITRGSVSTKRARDQAVAKLLIHKLAVMRQSGEEDFCAALRYAEEQVASEDRKRDILLRQADRVMLAGFYGQALRLYLSALRHDLCDRRAWMKLLRWAAFVSLPSLRKDLFSR